MIKGEEMLRDFKKEIHSRIYYIKIFVPVKNYSYILLFSQVITSAKAVVNKGIDSFPLK